MPLSRHAAFSGARAGVHDGGLIADNGVQCDSRDRQHYRARAIRGIPSTANVAGRLALPASVRSADSGRFGGFANLSDLRDAVACRKVECARGDYGSVSVRTLLLSYESGGRDEVASLKQVLLKHVFIKSTQPQLRPDAALCLLTLFDQMILRTYAGYIPTSRHTDGLPLPESIVSLSQFDGVVQDSADSGECGQ
jgi:hypothetical protein